VPVSEFRRMLESHGLPPTAIDASVALGEAIRAGEFDESSPALETLLGRPPVALEPFLKKAFAKA
jgi:hypothetical protein